jgi:hypothetical protein
VEKHASTPKLQPPTSSPVSWEFGVGTLELGIGVALSH